jgi:hypothetical protein
VANTFIKAEQVAAQMLGVLERDTVLAQFVWRDAVTDFKGAKNDTVSLRVPAYTTARTRTMRSNTAIVIDELDETKVDVTLDTHVYKAIRVTDEEMTLDIVNFGEQVTAPAMGSVVRKVDDSLATQFADASAEVTVNIDADDPYLAFVDARIALNNASVPMGQRFCAVGSNVEAAILKSDRLSKFDQSGSSDALREAVIGRMAGFTAVSCPGLDPDLAVFSHRTAFVLALVAPVVPAGASWGTTQTYRGMSLRVLRDYLPDDTNGPADRLLTDTFMGTGVVMDRGTIDADGKFQPSVDGTDDPILVRAVTGTLSGS